MTLLPNIILLAVIAASLVVFSKCIHGMIHLGPASYLEPISRKAPAKENHTKSNNDIIKIQSLKNRTVNTFIIDEQMMDFMESNDGPVQWNRNEIQTACDHINAYCILHKKPFRVTPNLRENTIEKYRIPIDTNIQFEETPCKSSNMICC